MDRILPDQRRHGVEEYRGQIRMIEQRLDDPLGLGPGQPWRQALLGAQQGVILRARAVTSITHDGISLSC